MGLAIYSIVQYLDDPARHEPRNIGVLLAIGGQLHREFVERDDVDPGVVFRFRELLEHVIDDELANESTPADRLIEDLARRRFSGFHLTEPLQASGLSDEPKVAVDALVERLVRPHSPRGSLCF